MKTGAATLLFLAMLSLAVSASQYDALTLHDRQDALVYVVGYRPGHIHYQEQGTDYYDPSEVSLSSAKPYLEYWESDRIRQNHTFGTTSPDYQSESVATAGDATAWVFTQENKLSAMVLALRNGELAAAEGKASGQAGPIKVTIPAKSRACTVFVFRPAINPTRVSLGSQQPYASDRKEDRAYHFEVINNDSDKDTSISMDGTVEGISIAGPTDVPLWFKSYDVGTGVTLVTAKLNNQAARFAAIVFSITNDQQCF